MKDQPPPKPTRQRILLTTLGIKPKSTKYSIDGSRTAEGKHAPLALLKLLSPAEKPDKVTALVRRLTELIQTHFTSELLTNPGKLKGKRKEKEFSPRQRKRGSLAPMRTQKLPGGFAFPPFA